MTGELTDRAAEAWQYARAGYRTVQRSVATPRTVRAEPISFTVRPAVLFAAVVGSVVTFAVFVVDIATTDYPVTYVDVVRIILGGGTRAENVVILDDAVPRALVAVLVGFGLGLAGSLTQLVARNPLATPDILGITAGASTAAVGALAFGASWGSWLATIGVPAAALLGGLATALLMYVLAWPGRKRAGLDPFRLVIVGVGLTWMLQALTGWLLTRASIQDVARAQTWLVGSVSQSSWSKVWPVACGVAVGIVVVVVLARQISALNLGGDMARGLGINTGRVTAATLLLAVAVAALAVSAAGPIAFVGLLAPQIAQRISFSPVPTPLTSGVFGALLVVAGDLFCRTVMPDGIPVGIVTAAIGGPFLIVLMIVMSRKATS